MGGALGGPSLQNLNSKGDSMSSYLEQRCRTLVTTDCAMVETNCTANMRESAFLATLILRHVLSVMLLGTQFSTDKALRT